MSNLSGRLTKVNHSTKPPKNKIDETRDIHPLVALWLTQNGYIYKHEYQMPDYGTVDFYATHSDGHTLLVEAKGEQNPVSAIFQVLAYHLQMPNSVPAIAIPSFMMSNRTQDTANKYNVKVIQVEYVAQLTPEVITPESILTEFWRKAIYILLATCSEQAKQYPSWRQVLNLEMFHATAEYSLELEKLGVDLKTSTLFVTERLMRALKTSTWAHLSMTDILAWICQDTSEGYIYELF